MSTSIICPNCKYQFEPTDAIARSVEEELRKEYNQKWKTLEVENDEKIKQKYQLLHQQEQDLHRKIEQERKGMIADLEKQLSERLRGDYEHKLQMLEDTNKTNESKLTEARQKEVEFLKKVEELRTKEQELDLQLQRKLSEERNKITEQIKNEEGERSRMRDEEYKMQLKEKDKQLEDQKRLSEEMKRKLEQGSMQMQGEVQELALEELLRSSFPFDIVREVSKGVRGADSVLTVRNNFGQECGIILFESKRTKQFSEEWIEKLKADMRSQDADIAVLVTQAMPKDLDMFGEYNGVWICSFAEVKAVVSVLRDLIIRVHKAAKNHENKGDKMTMLYNYLVSSEFVLQWRAISEGFTQMKSLIQTERNQMEKLWKAREKQLDKVLQNAFQIKGSIEGIAGNDIEVNLLPEPGDLLLE